MRELIRGYAATTFETARAAERLSTVASDLDGFSRVLAGSDVLRASLTDASIAPLQRRDVIVDLLADKVAPETTALLSYLVRFERAGELGSALSALTVIAEHTNQAGPQDLGIEPHGGHGAVRERIRGYAERVLQELSSASEIDEVEDELFRFSRALDDNANLRRVLQDINGTYEARSAIVSELLEGRAQQATVRIAKYVMRAGRLRDLVETFEKLVELAAAERGRRVAEVRAAVDLDESERDRLAVALGRLVERTVEVRVIHDPKVIGGVLVSVGDLIIDGTVRIRFERLRDLLAQAS